MPTYPFRCDAIKRTGLCDLSPFESDKPIEVKDGTVEISALLLGKHSTDIFLGYLLSGEATSLLTSPLSRKESL